MHFAKLKSEASNFIAGVTVHLHVCMPMPTELLRDLKLLVLANSQAFIIITTSIYAKEMLELLRSLYLVCWNHLG